jgi:hypothetical protein
MPKLQDRAIDVAKTAGIAVAPGVAPDWLMRPGRSECGPLWSTIAAIYSVLTDGLVMPDHMPSRERRAVDGLVVDAVGFQRILEIDEAQHFNAFRGASLDLYPPDAEVAYPLHAWRSMSQHKSRLEGGGFARPKPPLFGMKNGRHRQRAFRDALADLLPPLHGWGPTLRIGYFELEPWIWGTDAPTEFTRRFGSRFRVGAVSPNDYPSGPSPAHHSDAVPGAHAWTQPITGVDLAHGRIRIPAATKRMFPSSRITIGITLRGVKMTVPYDPRNGPGRNRSGVIRIGRSPLIGIVQAFERLSVSQEGEVFILE